MAAVAAPRRMVKIIIGEAGEETRVVHLLARAMLAIAMEVAGHLETKAKAEVELIRAMEVGPLGAAAGDLARAMAKVELKKRRQTKNILLHLLLNILVLVAQLGASGGAIESCDDVIGVVIAAM